MTNNKIINNMANRAVQNCIKYVGEEYRNLHLSRREEKLFEICLNTPFQRYEFYVDAETGEILGINAEPCMYFDMLYGTEEEVELMTLNIEQAS